MNPDGVTGTGPVLLTATSTNWIKYTYNRCFDTLDNKQQMAVIDLMGISTASDTFFQADCPRGVIPNGNNFQNKPKT